LPVDVRMLRNFWSKAVVPWWMDSLRNRPSARPNLRRHGRLLFEPLEQRLVLDVGPLIISELMADNEDFLADGDGYCSDWLEIHNPTDQEVDLTGWYLTDDLSDLQKWHFPPTSLLDNEYLVVFASDGRENVPNPVDPFVDPEGNLHTNFKLTDGGEPLALVQDDGETISSSLQFPPQFENVSYGWSQDFGTQGYFIQPSPREGAIGEPVGDPTQLIVISEIMYHPASENDLEEYIELYNRGIAPVNLLDWQFSAGVQFTFPDTTLQPGDYIVVAADTATFTAMYPTVTNVVGPWTGVLHNRSEQIELVTAAGGPADRVEYADEGDWGSRELGPTDRGHRGWHWVEDHDGGGKSLELINLAVSNKYGQNWTASLPDGGTPGTPNSVADDDIAPIITKVTHFPIIPRGSDPVTVTARVRDELAGGVSATLYYRVDASTYDRDEYPAHDPGAYTTAQMHDDGQHGDGDAGDGVYGVEIPAQADGAIVEFFVEAGDAGSNLRTFPAPSDVDGTPQQVTNLLYQVEDSFDPDEAWDPSGQPIYRMIMTNGEWLRLDDIGNGDSGDPLGLDDQESNAELNGTFISIDGTGVELRYNVGIRNRGSASRTANPNNHRVNFVHNAPWHGVSRININSRYTHSQVIGAALFQLGGIETADAAAVRIRVNGDDLAQTGSPMYGHYAALEVVDGDFTDVHFPDNSGGNAYVLHDDVNFGSGDLDYEGPEADAYRDTYFKFTNDEEDDWSDLIHMLDVLNNAPQETYLQDVAQVIDIDQWLRHIAMDSLFGNREGGLSTGRGDDFIIYAGVDDPRFVLVPYDLDTLLGQASSPRPTQDVLSGYQRVDGLYRLLTNPEIIRQYYALLLELIDDFYNPQTLDPLFDKVLGGWVAESKIDEMKQFVVNRVAGVLPQIERQIAVAVDPNLPVVDGYPKTTLDTAAFSGTADAAYARSVTINGMRADFSQRDGAWSIAENTGSLFTDTMISSDQVANWHVPTFGDDLLAWIDTDFDDDSWPNTVLVDPAGLLITEISTGYTDFVEIQNVAADEIDATGWTVLVNDPSLGIGGVNLMGWTLDAPVAASDVLYRTDDAGDEYWGDDIAWDPDDPGWAMIVDDQGNVRDFVAWRYDAADIATLEISYGDFDGIIVGDLWSGDGADLGGDAPGVEENVIAFGSEWHYLCPTNGIDPVESDLDFNSTWMQSAGYDGPAFSTEDYPAMLGYGRINYGPLATAIPRPPYAARYTSYFRNDFEFRSDMQDVGIEILSDDGAVIYVDGVEVARNNFSNPKDDNFKEFADGSRYPDGTPSENITKTVSLPDLAAGTHTIAVSVHQSANQQRPGIRSAPVRTSRGRNRGPGTHRTDRRRYGRRLPCQRVLHEGNGESSDDRSFRIRRTCRDGDRIQQPRSTVRCRHTGRRQRRDAGREHVALDQDRVPARLSSLVLRCTHVANEIRRRVRRLSQRRGGGSSQRDGSAHLRLRRFPAAPGQPGRCLRRVRYQQPDRFAAAGYKRAGDPRPRSHRPRRRLPHSGRTARLQHYYRRRGAQPGRQPRCCRVFRRARRDREFAPIRSCRRLV